VFEVIEVRFLKTIKKVDVLNAYDKWLSPKSKNRNRLVVKVPASEGPSASGRPLVDNSDSEKHNDKQVESFHAFCQRQTFGRIY
jgi:hypothetical protein